MTMTTLLTGVFVLGLPAWLLVEELAHRFGGRRALPAARVSASAVAGAVPTLGQRQAA
jgi:hypothetical protein